MSSRQRVIYFGTPELAADILQMLSESPLLEIVAVVTNPDAPQGRKQILTPSAVKLQAENLKIPVYHAEKLDSDFLQTLAALEPDLFLIVAYGKIFPKAFIDLPKFGSYNLHFSLLPKYRGASPVQSAILNGETVSGFTIFHLTENLDDGPISVQEQIDITEKMAVEVFAEMKEVGGHALRIFAEKIGSGASITPLDQDNSAATYCQKFQKSDGQIFPKTENAAEILRKYRALHIWPGIFLIHERSELRIKLLEITEWPHNEVPLSEDMFFFVEKDCGLKTADGALKVIEAQPAGKNSMRDVDFWNWYRQV